MSNLGRWSRAALTVIAMLAVAGCNFFMGLPMGDDIMLNYQSTSYHDDATMREQAIRFNGYEVKTEGDAFFVAFDCVHDAVEWCIGVQAPLGWGWGF